MKYQGKRTLLTTVFLFMLFLFACHQETQANLTPLAPDATIMAFGDSLTYGTGARVDQSYPSVLQKITGLKVINEGVSGDETTDGLMRIQKALTDHHPQLVVLTLGGNDFLRRRPIAQVKANLAAIIEMIKKSGAQIVLVAVPQAKIRLQLSPIYEELAAQYKIPVDTTTLIKLYNDDEYKSDTIHFNEKGYQVFAESIAQFLKERGAIKQIGENAWMK